MEGVFSHLVNAVKGNAALWQHETEKEDLFGSFSICGTSITLAGGEVLVVDQKEAFLCSWELEPCRIHKSPPFLLLQKSLRCYQNVLLAGQNSCWNVIL